MTDDQSDARDGAQTGEPAEEKLDLAAVAAHLAAKSQRGEGDPALDPRETGREEPREDPGEAAAGADAEVAGDEEAGVGDEGDAEADGPELTVAAHELSGAEIYAAVEALLFAADKPVTAAQIARALPQGINAREVRKELKAIREELSAGERGFELREIAGGWQLLSREKFGAYVAKLKKTAGARKLSGSALETLAVVAYKQPVARAEVERIRGVACGDMLRNLMEKRLVRIAGRSSELGNPLLYGTTPDFLNHFGLASIGDLPRSSELGRKPKPSEPAVPQDGGGRAAEAEAQARDGEAGDAPESQEGGAAAGPAAEQNASTGGQEGPDPAEGVAGAEGVSTL